MTNLFPQLSSIVNTQIGKLWKNTNLFQVDTDGLFELYLDSFPEGTNPHFRERTEHDCNCCKQFIRNYGGVVALDASGKRTTVWDIPASGTFYDEIVNRVREEVLKRPVVAPFFRKLGEGKVGSQFTVGDHKFDHFYGPNTPAARVVASPAAMIGAELSNFAVAKRGLTQFTLDIIDDLLGLIGQEGGLYKGHENKQNLETYRKLLVGYQSNPTDDYIWANLSNRVCLIRNTAFGTLMVDLAEGVDFDKAIKAYEVKVAPTNYKRTSAPVSPQMIQKGIQTIRELGLEPSLSRRFAVLGDLNLRDVIWVGNKKPLLEQGIAGLLDSLVTKAKPLRPRAQAITADEFISDILPNARDIQVQIANKHTANLFSLTTSVDPDAKKIFAWDNSFAWAYKGGVTDSITERVKNAGGSLEGELRVSLSWENIDDLDLHAYSGMEHCYYMNKCVAGATLDVDANAGHLRTDPVENMVWRTVPKTPIHIKVRNFNQRNLDSTTQGFQLQVAIRGEVKYNFHCPSNVLTHEEDMFTITREGTEFKLSNVNRRLKEENAPVEIWGIRTHEFLPVDSIMFSPNYWGDNQIGNKHLFFVLPDAKDDGNPRGIFNEFLHPSLLAHRKVFDLIGEKTKVPSSDKQVAGVGFSSTKVDQLLVRVTNEHGQVDYTVKFG